MRTRLLLVIALLWSSALGTVVSAQSGCEEDAFNRRLDGILATYEEARADDAYAAAEVLQQEVGALLTACGQADTPLAGMWHFVWLGADTSQCPNGGPTIGTADRNVVVSVDQATRQFSVADVFAPQALDFAPEEDGSFFYRRNLSNGSENFTVEYAATLEANDAITGTATAFLPSADCYLEATFEMGLVDPYTICVVGTLQGANLRSGPGTEFERAGSIAVNEEQPVLSQMLGSDNFTWWQIGDNQWVRSDVVSEAGDCAAVPMAEQ